MWPEENLLPIQLCPSPLNPGLHVHFEDPPEFSQIAFSLLLLEVFSASPPMPEMNPIVCTKSRDTRYLHSDQTSAVMQTSQRLGGVRCNA